MIGIEKSGLDSGELNRFHKTVEKFTRAFAEADAKEKKLEDTLSKDFLIALQYKNINFEEPSDIIWLHDIPFIEQHYGVIIDMKNHTWSYDKWKNIPIGKGRHLYSERGEPIQGILGIYDRRSERQLSVMVHDAIEANESYEKAFMNTLKKFSKK